jgi:hypothetical protein
MDCHHQPAAAIFTFALATAHFLPQQRPDSSVVHHA